jgi:hypothetical protein
MNCAKLALGRAMPACLRSLENTCDVFRDRVRGDEPDFGGETAVARKLSLLDGGGRAERRFDRE